MVAFAFVAALAFAQPVVAPVPSAAMQPGYGVVLSVTPVRVAADAGAAAGGSAARDARPAYRVRVRMADGTIQVRDIDRPQFHAGDRVLLTNAGDVVSDADSRGAGDADRGSTPPGLSRDGARPAEGAIKGGSIAPGERGGTPQSDAGKGAAAAGTRARQRCAQLHGSLREQCLADEALSRKGAAPRAPSAAPAR